RPKRRERVRPERRARDGERIDDTRRSHGVRRVPVRARRRPTRLHRLGLRSRRLALGALTLVASATPELGSGVAQRGSVNRSGRTLAYSPAAIAAPIARLTALSISFHAGSARRRGETVARSASIA